MHKRLRKLASAAEWRWASGQLPGRSDALRVLHIFTFSADAHASHDAEHAFSCEKGSAVVVAPVPTQIIPAKDKWR